MYSINRKSDGSAASNPKLYFNDTKSAGGYNAHATQNIPFQIISPNIANIAVPGTTVSAARYKCYEPPFCCRSHENQQW